MLVVVEGEIAIFTSSMTNDVNSGAGIKTVQRNKLSKLEITQVTNLVFSKVEIIVRLPP